ncbi:MAG: pre-peptidase C-terminal domain-containing protein [Planctomycetales bacterium]|nr:pre-peptidase C-terminal domain-containing protein [Planctomycetales bacterium]
MSASGNANYDAALADSGIGGRSEGNYKLRLDFRPPADSVLRDADTEGAGTAFDGDADGNPGGVFNFWFRPGNTTNTKFVDKVAATGGNGSLATPYKYIKDALASATPGSVVRIVGNSGADGNYATLSDNLAYEIGFNSSGQPLPDGSTFDVPRDVSVMIDAGAILKLRRARVGVGSTSASVDRSAGSLLVLGTPTLQTTDGVVLKDGNGNALSGNVIFTSTNESAVGKSASTGTQSTTPAAGDWGGIDFRNRVDSSNPTRKNLEALGEFMNWVSHADIRYGGGQVVIDGVSQVVTPVQMVDSRPSVFNSIVTRSADSALSATPNSFLESNFHSPAEQGSGSFSVDYDRVGPAIHGNTLVNNSINGLQVRVRTSSATQLEKLTVPGRFDDTDIVHYLPENLEIAGTPGGAKIALEAPASTQVLLTAQSGGTLPSGTYNYRFTTDYGSIEGPASEPTRSLSTAGTGSIVLSSLPTGITRIYRSAVGGNGPYTLVHVVTAATGTFIDNGSDLGTIYTPTVAPVITRLDARLTIDPGTIVKAQGARIDVAMGGQLIAEGTDGNPVVFTSLDDVRYGAGGTFDTANRAASKSAAAGDWGGIYIGHTSKASLDRSVISFGGGTTRVEGGFADFNAVEVHQGDLRLANSRLEFNANGSTTSTDVQRGGRGTNSSATLFVRGSQPIVVDNIIRNNAGNAISINVSALNSDDVSDPGRSTGPADRYGSAMGNRGPLISGNRIDSNAINGLVVRGGPLTTEGVWDDTDIVHVVQSEITIPDFHAFGGLRLTSATNESLVVKLGGANAGFTATGTPLDNADRIGGSLQIIGQPGFPVILTSLNDSSVGAGFTLDGNVQSQTVAGNIAPQGGDWRSVLLETYSNDRNVAIVSELESPESLAPRSNETPNSAAYLGALAPNEKAGDENQRLGFQVEALIAAPSDVDVYSFHAQGGTLVWLDIDRTDNSLDTVIELVDANGKTLALSNDTLTEDVDPTTIYVDPEFPSDAVGTLRISPRELYYQSAQGAAKDLYSTNPRDAGMRVRLPGAVGQTNLYHVRVRSSNLHSGDPLSRLTDPALIGAGLTQGRYQLQIRLSEIDEIPGSAVNFADIRYAQTGLQLVGVPYNSPLLGENGEIEIGNDVQTGAQALGNLLQTNRQALSVAGNIDNTTDVDWFSFNIDYQRIRPTAIREYFSTIFDVDYANGIGRPDTSLYVFNANGNLILGGLGSNVVDDQASPLNAADNSDLSRGSAGSLDPYIGSYELPAGQYFLAVTNSNMLPAALSEGLIRLQPIEGIQLIAEDHIDYQGGSTALAPQVPILFDTDAAVQWGLGDVALYVSRDNGGTAFDSAQSEIFMVNPFTGQQIVSGFGIQDFDIEDIAFRPNGELRAFDRSVFNAAANADKDVLVDYLNIDTGTGAFTATGVSGLETFHIEVTNAVPAAVASNDGVNPEAITFANMFGQERGFFVGNRPTPSDPFNLGTGQLKSPRYDNFTTDIIANVGTDRPGLTYFSNILYEFDEATGAAVSAPSADKVSPASGTGAGTAVRERAYIETRDLSGATSQLLVVPEATTSNGGAMVQLLQDGQTFRLLDSSTNLPLTFEFDFGPQLLLNINPASTNFIRDGLQFVLDGVTYEFDTGSVVIFNALNGSQLSDGSTVTIKNQTGETHVLEFNSDNSLSNPSNINVPFTSATSQSQLIQSLIAAVNGIAGFGVHASVAGGNRISFAGSSTVDPVTVTGLGMSVVATPGVTAGAVRIAVAESYSEEEVAGAIASAMPASIAASYDSGRLNFAGALNGTFTQIVNAGLATSLGTSGAVQAGNVAVRIQANDSADIVAIRISQAINSLGIPGLSSTPSGDRVTITGGAITNPGVLKAAGIAPGGLIRGIATIGTTLFAVTDTGGLFRLNNPTAFRGTVTNSYVTSASDLLGIRFNGLSAGPTVTLSNGDLSQLLFGIDENGVIYAFDATGKLQPVFANGATSINTGLRGANGLAFSTLQSNLWSRTNAADNTNREGDAGHGQDGSSNQSRGAVSGGSAYYFGDRSAVNFNFPGGAAGALESEVFSLAGIGEADLPMLYFSYYLETEPNPESLNNGFDMRDAFRVYGSGEDGNWVLLGTNNSNPNRELAIDRDVQELVDNTGQWLQARIPLNRLAGLDNVKLRVEFSTAGGFGFGQQGGQGPEIRTVAGDQLVDGQSLFINGQRFEIEMGTTLTLPSGAQLSNGDSVTIDNIRYVFTDGTGPAVVAPDVPVFFQPGQTADQVAANFQIAVAAASAAYGTINGMGFSLETNEVISHAKATGITGSNVIASGTGSIGDNASLVDAGLDIDMGRISVQQGSTVTVNVNAASGSTLDSYLRIFDDQGREIARNDNFGAGSDSQVSFVATYSGTYYVAVSGAGNDNYNANVEGTAAVGSTGDYDITIQVTTSFSAILAGNQVQLNGANQVSVAAGTPISVTGSAGTNGVPVFVTAGMSAAEVAVALQNAIVGYFAVGVNGAYTPYPVRGGDTLNLTGLTVSSAGPFGLTTNFVGDQFNAFRSPLRAQANAFEGVYVDDFIIGVAGRGEQIVGASNDTNFVVNPTGSNQILTGPYQFEIRGGEEYGVPGFAGIALTETFTPTSRQAPGISLQFRAAANLVAGQTFTISDGVRTVIFELDDISDGLPVGSGHVALPFASSVFDPQSGGTISESAKIIAARFRDLLNSPAVQAQLNISANLINNDRTGATSDTVVLIGNAVVDMPTSIGSTLISDGVGASNRERPQGQVVVSASRISNSQNFGAEISAAPRDPQTGAAQPGTPRNTVTINDERLAPGAVIMNSEFLFNGAGGISVQGDTASANLPPAAIPFVRLVNNTVLGGSVAVQSSFTSEVYSNQLFRMGNLAFADSVVSYNPTAGGGIAPLAGLDVPADALGVPNFSGSGEPLAGQGVVSLGRGGELVVQFTDNFLTGSGDSRPDLMIFEVGDSEDINVSVSEDGATFTSVGRASALSPKIDLDAFGFGPFSRISYVRLSDVAAQGSLTGDSVGADVDSVGAIFSVPVENYTPGGQGIAVTQNASATLLNNVLVNSSVGIQVDASSSSTIVGGTIFQHNAANVGGSAVTGQFPNVVPNYVPIFTDITAGNLYPAATAPQIDSSIDSLEDRPALVTVKSPLGLAASPILAPQYDINGQLRVDDPAVETPSGLGENVFKDRGAQDRADFAGPSVVLINPADNDLMGLDTNLDTGVVELTSATLHYFDIQIFDGLEPVDPNRGAGVDDRTVSSSSILLYRNGVPLVEGIDYSFGYDSTNGVIRLQALAGVWQSESIYTIEFVNTSQSLINAAAASAYNDGATFSIIDQNGVVHRFEFELGYLVTVPTTDGIIANVADGGTFAVDDGLERLTFEFDNDSFVSSNNIAVAIGTTPTPSSVALAIKNAIAAAGLTVTVDEVGTGQLQITGKAGDVFLVQDSGLIVTGSIGVQREFGLQMPLVAGVPTGLADGETFSINQSGIITTFELDSNGTVLPGSVPVRFVDGISAADLGAAIIEAIQDAAIGLSPSYGGAGLVILGGDSNTVLDLTNTNLLQSGVAGQSGSLAVNLPAGASDTEVASLLMQLIESQGISGLTMTQFGTRIVIDGIEGVTGTGTSQVGAITDLVGNPIKGNQPDGSTKVDILLGEGFDYGDAPAPYTSTAADSGPRHKVVNGLSLGATVSTDADAKLPNADSDDGVTFGSFVAAFNADLTINVTNTTGNQAYLSLWVDFDGNGFFASTEALALGDAVGAGSHVLSTLVPSSAMVGEVYVRARLSTNRDSLLSSNGDSPDGEVEDYAITIQGNPYHNLSNRLDVNGDGFVSPIDALQVINYLNNPLNPTSLTLPAPGVPPYIDVNGDGSVTPQDALLIINYLNTLPAGGEGEGVTDAMANDWMGNMLNAAPPVSGHDVAFDDDDDGLAWESSSYSTLGADEFFGEIL